MAITIKRQPQTLQPVYNEIVYVFDSSNKTEQKFSYVIDIKVNNINVSRVNINSNPQGFGILDVSKHIQPFITSDLDTISNQTFKLIPNSAADYQIEATESYLTSDDYFSIISTGGKATYNFGTLKNTFVIGDFIDIQSGISSYNGSQEITNIQLFASQTLITTTRLFSSSSTGTGKPSSGAPFIDTSNKITSPLRYSFNAVFDFNDFRNFIRNFSGQTYLMGISPVGKFLSNVPSEYVTDLNDRIVLNYCFKENVNINAELQVNYLKIVSNLGTFYKLNTVIPSVLVPRQFASVYVGGYNIANGGTTAGSGVNAIDSTTKEYEVSFVNENFVQTSEVIKFKLVNNCNNYNGYRLIYLNKFGSFTSFNFSLSHQKNIRVRKKTYSKNYGSYDDSQAGSTASYGYNSYDAGTSVIDVDKSEIYAVNSDYVSEAVGNTIQDLIESPEVYHVLDDGTRRAVDIKTSSTKIKQTKVDKLINYSITFEYAVKNNSQV